MSSAPLPHDTVAEQAVLGACLLALESFDDAEATGLAEGDFHSPAHGHIWESIARLAGAGTKPDPVTVSADLSSRGLLEAVGGSGLLIALTGHAGGLTSAGSYALSVIKASRLRRLIAAAAEIHERATRPVDDVDKVLGWAEQTIGQATDQATLGNRPETAHQMMIDLLEDIDSPKRPPGIQTPWAHLNGITGGLRPGITVVFARPGCGKSAWGMNMAVCAAELGIPTLLCSLEMDRASIAARLVAYRSGINHGLIRDRRMGATDQERVAAAALQIASLPLHVHDGYQQTVAHIGSAARRIPDLGLLIIDYVQLLTPATTGRRADNRQTEVAAVSQELVRLRRRLGIPVVALAQTNRPAEAGIPKRPTMRDIRETGQLENDADLAISLFREEQGNPDTKNRGTMEMFVHKQRNGMSNVSVNVGWDGPTFRIPDLPNLTGAL